MAFLDRMCSVATPREGGCWADALCGGVTAITSGAIVGTVAAAAINSTGSFGSSLAMSAPIGAAASGFGALAGRVAAKILVKKSNPCLNFLAGAIGGAAFVSSTSNLVIVAYTNEFPIFSLQTFLAGCGAVIGGSMPLSCGLFQNPRLNAMAAAGMVSLGGGTAASIYLGALLGTSPEIGISNGMKMGLGGVAGLLGCLFPPQPTPGALQDQD